MLERTLELKLNFWLHAYYIHIGSANTISYHSSFFLCSTIACLLTVIVKCKSWFLLIRCTQLQ